ncbi:MAG: SulP family inorganic anion transporter [Armatimonadota bacterium]
MTARGAASGPRTSEPGRQSRAGRPRSGLRRDVLAGLINAVVSVPDGLASAALAGVNPVYGLYTSIAAPIGGSLLVSAQLMQVSTTSASALAAGQVLQSYPPAQREPALFLLTVLIGVFLALFGFLRLGRLVRFVSFSVMTGFLIGVAVVLILDQLAPLVGFSPEGSSELTQFLDLLANAGAFHWTTILTGVLALGLAVGVARTPLEPLASLVALVVPSLLVAAAGWEEVRVVADVSPIPRGIPTLALPDLSFLSFELVGSALAVAAVIAVQGAGVSESVENPDGTRISPSRDLVAQGAANVGSGLLSGIPAGGSVGQTALNVNVGARSRWAGVLGGVWMLVFVMLIPGLVSRVPMAVLAALMIVAGVSAIDVDEARSIWQTGWPSRVAAGTTFAATLFLPIQIAVGIGAALSALLHLYASSTDVSVVALVEREDGRIEECPAPERLRSREVTVLRVYGHLFYAGAWTLERLLPSPEGTSHPVVILRLRGRSRFGATLIDVLNDYAERLADVEGRLYLSGLGSEAYAQVTRSGKLRLAGPVHAYGATTIVGHSTREAVSDARAWLARLGGEGSPAGDRAAAGGEERGDGSGRGVA